MISSISQPDHLTKLMSNSQSELLGAKMCQPNYFLSKQRRLLKLVNNLNYEQQVQQQRYSYRQTDRQTHEKGGEKRDEPQRQARRKTTKEEYH